MADRARARNPAPALNGRAYPITDHSYDVIVIGALGVFSVLRVAFGSAA